MSNKLFIKNASIVTPSEIIIGHLLMNDGKISEIGNIEQATDCLIIDAQQNYLLPGGIDAHVHFDLETPNGKTADDFISGSKAALAGGTTTIIDFITPKRKQSLLSAFNNRLKQAQNIYTDFSFHQSITSWNTGTAQQMEDAVKQQGITSFKTYLTYSGSIGINLEILEKVMLQAAKLNAIVLVHAENGKLNDQLSKEYEKSLRNPGFIHKKTHPVESEVQAIQDVIKLTEKTNCQTYIVHVSTKKGIQAIHEAKEKGLPIYAETCPQYFVFNDIAYSKSGRKSIENILSPPLRQRTHQQAILQSLAKGNFDCVSTDHCSFNWQVKNNKNYFKIPHGIGGVQYRILMSHYHLISSSLISWLDFVHLTAENPAKIFGLQSKGKIEIGFDADLVLFNQNIDRSEIGTLKDFSKSDINVYKNENIFGEIEMVIKGGHIVFKNGELTDGLTSGCFIKRK